MRLKVKNFVRSAPFAACNASGGLVARSVQLLIVITVENVIDSVSWAFRPVCYISAARTLLCIDYSIVVTHHNPIRYIDQLRLLLLVLLNLHLVILTELGSVSMALANHNRFGHASALDINVRELA